MKYLLSLALALALYQGHPGAPYVACELRGASAVVEYGTGHGMGAEDIEVMKAFCVRQALYGGRGEDFWQLPVTDKDLRDARYFVRNVDYYGGGGNP